MQSKDSSGQCSVKVDGQPVFIMMRWKVLSDDLTVISGKPPISWEVKLLSRVQLFAIPWIVANQAPPSMEFSKQVDWSGLSFPSPGDLPDPGIEPGSPTMQTDTLPSEPPGKPAGSIENSAT